MSGQFGTTYDVSVDGQRFLMIKDVDSASAKASQQMVFVQHWSEELKRLAPAN
jgi:hypothetical protein